MSKTELSLEQVLKMIESHFLFLRGDNSKKVSFGNCIIPLYDFKDHSTEVFQNKDLRGADFFNSEFRLPAKFYGRYGIGKVNFSGANFSGADVRNIDFSQANLENAIFIDAIFDQGQFSDAQKQKMIFTQKELELSRQVSSQQATIEVKNEEIAKKEERIEEVTEEIEKKDEVIHQTKAEQTKKLQHGFMVLKEEFALEERRWMIAVITSLIILVSFAAAPILEVFGFQYTGEVLKNICYLLLSLIGSIVAIMFVAGDNPNVQAYKTIDVILNWIRKWVGPIVILALVVIVVNSGNELKKSFLNTSIPSQSSESKVSNGSIIYNKWKEFLPLEILFFSLLYFCISQYVKAKNLRIEHQNKIAIIDGYQAFKAMFGNDKDGLKTFSPNVADVLFCKALDKDGKEQNLPVDSVVRIAESMANIKPKS